MHKRVNDSDADTPLGSTIIRFTDSPEKKSVCILNLNPPLENTIDWQINFPLGNRGKN